jgi:hypothetical protein
MSLARTSCEHLQPDQVMKGHEDQSEAHVVEPAVLSPHMEHIAKTLAATHGMDWSQEGARLVLSIPERPERWLLINLDGERFSLTGCLVEQDNSLIPEVDMVFTMHPEGWEPIELLYSNEIFAAFEEAAINDNLPVYDSEGNLRFDTFTEYWAKQLEKWMDVSVATSWDDA